MTPILYLSAVTVWDPRIDSVQPNGGASHGKRQRRKPLPTWRRGRGHSNNDFFNIGLRLSEFDADRQGVTGDPEDAGEMRVPSLRNVGLRARLMHTGEFGHLSEAIAFYNTATALPGVDEIPGVGAYVFDLTGFDSYDLDAFLRTGLLDPRVAEEIFPFDRPTLGSEARR